MQNRKGREKTIQKVKTKTESNMKRITKGDWRIIKWVAICLLPVFIYALYLVYNLQQTIKMMESAK
jgi:uncharacterized membrane protein YukC